MAHARRIIEQDLTTAAVEKLKIELAAQAAATALPTDLMRKVVQRLEKYPYLSWGQAVAGLFLDKENQEKYLPLLSPSSYD